MNSQRFPTHTLVLAMAALLVTMSSAALADIVAKPKAGASFVVVGRGGTFKFQVKDTGEVFMPDLLLATSAFPCPVPVCVDPAGQLVPCFLGTTPACDPPCQNGYCVPGNQCACTNGWTGPTCGVPVCIPSCENGTCVAPNLCECSPGWTGDACDSLELNCGNGVIDLGEQCDDAGDSVTCDSDCTYATCRDGHANAQAGEECDDGNPFYFDACVECSLASCGDGHVWSGVEECDDGRNDDGDGCSAICTLECVSTTEVCDGIDNDCNGWPDDGFGTTTCGVGACQRTVQDCLYGSLQRCEPGPPGTETCNGLDDDCNAFVDDGLGQTTCGSGICQVTVNNCVGGVPRACTPNPGAAIQEVCGNSLDDDCDGAVDEVDCDP